MGESGSFTSLSDLINSHLSKPDIQASGSENHIDNLIIKSGGSSSTGLGGGSVSDTGLLQPPIRRFIIPSLNLGIRDPGKSDILAKQISNKFKALEISENQKKEEQELKRKAQESKKQEDDDIIDLMKCLQFPYNPEAPRPPSPDITDEYIPTLDCYQLDEMPPPKVQQPKLPCLLDGLLPSIDISKRPRNTNISGMGRVICTRFVEQCGPYLGRVKIETNIVRFDFSTPSPDDIVKENLKKPFAEQSRTLF